MDLIVTDATGKPVASHASYTLDLAFGSGENDFDLQVEDAALKAGSRIMIDGTEYGGIIDDTDVDVDGGLSTVTWHGRDWHGVLASKIMPPKLFWRARFRPRRDFLQTRPPSSATSSGSH